jgi:D-methionine transport system substrate-binding protein
MRLSFSALGRRSLGAFALSLAFSAGLTGAAKAADQTIRVGIMSGEDEDVWRVVAQNASKEGLIIKITTFEDYTQPNEALNEHDLDANAFQHKPYLDAQIKAEGYHIVPVGYTLVEPIGLYSSKYKSVADLPDGATIGVPNDPSNEGRALLLLQHVGLIAVDRSAGILATALDIQDNKRNIHIKELDAGIVGRSLPDLAAAVVNTDWALKSGIKIPQQRIAQEPIANNPYRNFIAVNTDDANAPWVKPLVAAYQQENVRNELLRVYHGATLAAW